jgi:abortive infection bacteriophage resistance protein
MSKPAKTYPEQLQILKDRGLGVPDESFALHCLAHHNYYRLSAYRFPFTLPGQPDHFQPGTTFSQLWNLYQFDRELRRLVIEGCKRVEISVRSRWAYEIGHQLGPLAYLENRHFADPGIHAKTLTKLAQEMARSKETFIQHHHKTLHMDWPPVWVLIEVASFGNVSSLLQQTVPPRLRQAVADTYGLDETTFCSLFHHLSVVRNTAAHHSRLWNRRFVVTFQLPRKKPPQLWPNFSTCPRQGTGRERNLYNTLVLLVHLIQVIEPEGCWPQRLVAHLDTLDPALQTHMGCPEAWQQRPLWQPLTLPGDPA